MTCAIDNCGRKVFSREWCQKHYTRWRRHGDPLLTYSNREVPQLERVMRRVVFDAASGCWIWTGPKNRSGYGCTRVERQGTTLIHRWLYQRLRGEIADGLPLDHLCRVRECVNPDHLEPVTDRENTLRGMSPGAIVTRTGRCMRGHDLAVHGYIRPDGRGRNCLVCQEARRLDRTA